MGRVRIIGGRWRGRLLDVADAPGLRPTPDRVRETLFNWLGQNLSGLACLDLFAGTGALGFEAASRGAAAVVMVERDARASRMLREGARLLGAGNVEVVRGDALEFLAGNRRRFDVIFLDPPYHSPLLHRALHASGAHLAPGGRVYAESSAALEPGEQWEVVRKGRAGQVAYHLLRQARQETSATGVDP